VPKLLLLAFLVSVAFASNVQELTQKAQNGDKAAQIALAKHYELQNDVAQSLYWYKSAALNDNATPQIPVQSGTNVQSYGEKTVKNFTDAVNGERTKQSLLQILTSNFALNPYKSNYFMPATYDFKAKTDGREKFESMFQLSFLIPVSKNLLGYDESIRLGYTQQSWWQTAQDSAPFRETNYMPEIFVDIPSEYAFLKSLKMLRFGLLHKSNGQSGLDSRSLNALYMKGFFQYENLFLTLHNWYRIPESEKDSPTDANGDDNPKYIDYYGDGEVELKYLHNAHIFEATYRYSFSRLDRGAINLGWSFPIRQNLFGYVKYFYGYGESLIDFDQKIERLGIGIQFTR
jgi:phospholipase A1